MTKSYTVHSVSSPDSDPEKIDWQSATSLQIDQFHPRSAAHRPRASATLLRTSRSFLLRFDVKDDFAVSRATQYQDQVSQDSCVEFFVQPPRGGGYFNFEFNCGGTMLLYYIEDPTLTPTGLAKYTPVPAEAAAGVRVFHSMPSLVVPELTEPTAWWLTCHIPFEIMEAYTGPVAINRGDRWRANFFKCAANSLHPHWASWNAIGEALNFHQPLRFGDLVFE
jgi:hypothetical protein